MSNSLADLTSAHHGPSPADRCRPGALQLAARWLRLPRRSRRYPDSRRGRRGRRARCTASRAATPALRTPPAGGSRRWSTRPGRPRPGSSAAASDEVIFGANMTSLNFTLSRTLGRELKPGDEIVVTRLDHDANVAPWLDLASRPRSAGPARGCARRHHAGSRRPRTAARPADQGGGLPLGGELDRDDRGRAGDLRSCPLGRRAGLGGRRPVRSARADGRRAPSAPTS